MTVTPIHQTSPSTAVVGFPSPTEIEAIEAQVSRFAKSNLLPSQIRGKDADVFTILMVARDLGLPATSGLFKVHVVEGKPTLSSDLMLALGLQHGHDLWVEHSSAESATACGTRRGSARVQSITYTIEDAQRAGLAGKQNWKQNPAAMLRARAISGLCRVLIPDVLGGIAASTEEATDQPEPVALTHDEAVAKLQQIKQAEPLPEPVTVDGAVVPDAASTDAPFDEVTARVAQLLIRAESADDELGLRQVWNDAEAEGLLDTALSPDGDTLRGYITAEVAAIRDRSEQ